MKKQLTERQILQTWNSEYNISIRSGFSITEAVQRADAALAAKRAQIKEVQAKAAATIILNELREQPPWQIEYRFRRKQGYSEERARQLADAYVLESEALIAAQENSDAPAPVKRSPNGYNLYWCASANCYVSVPED